MCLTLFNADSIRRLFEYIKQRLHSLNNAAIDQLIIYFKKQWDNGSRYFTAEDWTTWNAITQTNNDCENWNGKFWQQLTKSRNLYDLAKALVTDANKYISSIDVREPVQQKASQRKKNDEIAQVLRDFEQEDLQPKEALIKLVNLSNGICRRDNQGDPDVDIDSDYE